MYGLKHHVLGATEKLQDLSVYCIFNNFSKLKPLKLTKFAFFIREFF